MESRFQVSHNKLWLKMDKDSESLRGNIFPTKLKSEGDSFQHV